MPVSGAIFTLIAVLLFELRLIFGEEAFLARKLGPDYEAYKQAVPRLVPKMRPSIGSADVRPKWLQSIVSEILPVGFTVCFAVFAWRYNAFLLTKCLLICFGVSLVVKALIRERNKVAGRKKERRLPSSPPRHVASKNPAARLCREPCRRWIRWNYFFGGAMMSLAALATRNFTTVFALILMVSPVCGLRPRRALRSAFTSVPSAGNYEYAVLLGFLDCCFSQQIQKSMLTVYL